MPIYRSITASKESERRIAEGLLKLKEAFQEVDLPRRNLSDTLLLATWNIREFDSTKYGVRGREPIFYIAEIVDRFDLVAIQEVREDLGQTKGRSSILPRCPLGARGSRVWGGRTTR